MSDVTYRQIDDKEFEMLEPIFTANGAQPPNPGLRTAIVAEDDTRIVGALVLQFAAHSEPLWIDPEYTGRVSFKTMVARLDSLVQRYGGTGYYAFAPDDKVAKMCELAGLVEVPWKIYRRNL